MFGSVTVSEAARLREFAQENGQLERRLAEAMLDSAALNGLLDGKWQARGSRARRSESRLPHVRRVLRAALGW